MIDLHTVKAAFDEAEQLIKRYERLNLSVLLSAVNQLRYAGHHLLKAEVALDQKSRTTQLDQAYRHAKRAGFDARECAISELLRVFNAFHASGYPQYAIDAILPDYETWRPRLFECQRRIERTKKLHDLSDAEIQALDCDLDWLADKRLVLLSVISKLDSAREIEEQKQREAESLAQQNRDRTIALKADRRYYISIAIALISLALSAYGIFR